MNQVPKCCLSCEMMNCEEPCNIYFEEINSTKKRCYILQNRFWMFYVNHNYSCINCDKSIANAKEFEDVNEASKVVELLNGWYDLKGKERFEVREKLGI